MAIILNKARTHLLVHPLFVFKQKLKNTSPKIHGLPSLFSRFDQAVLLVVEIDQVSWLGWSFSVNKMMMMMMNDDDDDES